MRQSALIGLLLLLAALATVMPISNGNWAPLAGWTDADAASVYIVDKIGLLCPRVSMATNGLALRRRCRLCSYPEQKEPGDRHDGLQGRLED